MHRFLGWGCAYPWWGALFCLQRCQNTYNTNAFLLLGVRADCSCSPECCLQVLPACALCFKHETPFFMGIFGYLGPHFYFLFSLCNTHHSYYINMCLSMYFCGTGFPLALQALWGQVPCFIQLQIDIIHHDAQRERNQTTAFEWIHQWCTEDYMLTKINFEFKYKNTNLVFKTWIKPTP